MDDDEADLVGIPSRLYGLHHQFEEWADPQDQHVAVVTRDTLLMDGRVVAEGETITPRDARRLGVPHTIRSGDAESFDRDCE